MKVPIGLQNRLTHAKSCATRAADSALDRLERIAATSTPAETSRIRLTCVFLQWDPARAPAELNALAECLRCAPGIESNIILVNNRAPGTPTARNDNATFMVAGDNSAYEFSGLQAGIDAARTRGIVTDVWVLANDRYRADDWPFLRYLTVPMVQAAMEIRGIVGHIDGYPRAVSSNGYSIRRWVASSFLVMPDAVLDLCSPLVSVTRDDVHRFVDEADGETIRADSSIGPEHAAYLRTWLTGARGTNLRTRWYGAAPQGLLDRNVLHRKLQSILNEQFLSARALALGVPLVSSEVAHRLGTLGLERPFVRRELGRIRRCGGSPVSGVRNRIDRARLVLHGIVES
jgi:hypothetical protein